MSVVCSFDNKNSIVANFLLGKQQGYVVFFFVFFFRDEGQLTTSRNVKTLYVGCFSMFFVCFDYVGMLFLV